MIVVWMTLWDSEIIRKAGRKAGFTETYSTYLPFPKTFLYEIPALFTSTPTVFSLQIFSSWSEACWISFWLERSARTVSHFCPISTTHCWIDLSFSGFLPTTIIFNPLLASCLTYSAPMPSSDRWLLSQKMKTKTHRFLQSQWPNHQTVWNQLVWMPNWMDY